MADLQSIIHGHIKNMTIYEKLDLLSGNGSFRSHTFENINIPTVQYLDGGTGMNWEQLMGDWMHINTGTVREILSHFDEPEALSEEHQKIRDDFIQQLQKRGCSCEQPGCYPPGILLGATWNSDVVYQCGKALGEEASDYHVDILLGTPNVNLLRDPLNGRFFEGYSEDPFLITELAPELVKGVQESGVLANVKHFAANNLEAYRQGIDEHISERALEELYLPGFKACVERGKVKTLMTAYNKINGVACTENAHLIDRLRNEWGFGNHLVLSDWGAVYDHPASVLAGNDVAMPCGGNPTDFMNALEHGLISEDDVNEAVAHILYTFYQTPAGRKALAGEAGVEHISIPTMRTSASLTQEKTNGSIAAYNAVAEGAVLLKNEKDSLPLKKHTKIAIVGEETAHFHDCGDGSARVITNKTTSLLTELSNDSDYECAYFENMTYNCLEGYDYAIVTAYVQGQEGRDRSSLNIPSAYESHIKETIREAKMSNTRIILLLNVCGPVDLRDYVDNVDAILCFFFPGMEGGRAVKDILTGAVNPSGKLPVTFPKRLQDCPTYLNPPSPDWTINYGEGIYVGYRYYDKKDIAPLYPFGYGLSYTTFRISNVEADCPTELKMGDMIQIRCCVTNTGDRSGKEVIQLYVSDPVSYLDKPLRELKAFTKIQLDAGESQTVVFQLPVQALASYDPKFHSWEVEPGQFLIYVGQSSRDLQEPLLIHVLDHSRYDFGEDTPFIRIVDNKFAYETMLNLCAEYGITEDYFVGFKIYTPYYDLGYILDQVFKNHPSEEGTEANARIYKELKRIPTWSYEYSKS